MDRRTLASFARASCATALAMWVAVAVVSCGRGEEPSSSAASPVSPEIEGEESTSHGVDDLAMNQTPMSRNPTQRDPTHRLANTGSLTRDDVPPSMQGCFDCHRPTIESYLEHGMSQSIGQVEEVPTGTVSNPSTGMRYALRQSESGPWLDGTNSSGGKRKQRVVGRIGAGVFDISWATEEVDPWTGAPTGRLFFAPVEFITGRGHELSPFAQTPSSPGLDFPLVESCLTCHTLSRTSQLPRASVDAPRWLRARRTCFRPTRSVPMHSSTSRRSLATLATVTRLDM